VPDEPQIITGVQFNECFFDRCIARLNGYRLTERHSLPPGKRNVDYIIGNFAVELKILELDPLSSPDHQRSIQRFYREEFPRGPLNVTANRRLIRLTGQLSQKYWRHILGRPNQRALADAAAQIADTKTFIELPIRGAVLLVNAGAFPFDPTSFYRLIVDYRACYPEIEAAHALFGLPTIVSQGSPPVVTYAEVTDSNDSDALALGQRIGTSIKTEIELLTGKQSLETPFALGAGQPKPMFTMTPKGILFRRFSP
jgi:hypothetical protein